MTQNNAAASSTADREIVITRMINAPQALVFEVWTDPAHLDEWWGPKGFANTTHSVDIRTGGEWIYTMHGPDGTDYPNRMRFKEVTAPHRLAYIHDEGRDNDENAFEATVTFEAVGDKTKLTLHTIFPTAAQRKLVVEKFGAIEGGNQTISRFEAQLEQAMQVQQLVITREVNAPREVVFKAFSSADALAKWWGPKGMDLDHVALDFRPGGKFHYCMKANGFEMWGIFHYREIVAPERIVFVSSFADKDGNIIRAPFFEGKWPLEVLNVLTLTEKGDKTLITIAGGPINASIAELRQFESNHESMQGGFAGTFDKLDEYLAKQNN